MSTRYIRAQGACVLLILALAGLQASATTIHVPGECGLADAFGQATEGDTVLIASGVYSVSQTLYLPSGVTIQSETGSPAAVIVSGGNVRQILRAQGVSNVVLRGLTLSEGNSEWLEYGAGLRCDDSQLVLDNVVFRDNVTPSAGGGMYCSGSDVALTDCVFEGNEVGDVQFSNNFQWYVGRGGGLCCTGGSTVSAERVTFTGNISWASGGGLFAGDSSTHVTLSHCSLTNNEAVGPHGPLDDFQCGGGIYSDEAEVVLEDVSFESNVSDGVGAAVSSYGGHAHFTIEDCSFTEGESRLSGGALYVYVGSEDLVVRDCLFGSNIAGHTGGAAWIRTGGSLSAFSDCVFVNNEAGDSGGAVLIQYRPMNLTNCTFYGNRSALGSDICYSWASGGAVNNCILSSGGGGLPMACTDLPVQRGFESAPEVTHCCVFGNAAGDSLCGVLGDNLFIDPLFCGPEERDLSLCSNSPCLPVNNNWGELIGALGEGCGPCQTSVQRASWGAIKAMFGR
jgi:hypothetical protein